jgi:hypothetical protein
VNGKHPHKSHWKELVAQEAARRTSPKETEGDQAEVAAGAAAPKVPALSLPALYRQYFHHYRYGWLAAALFIQAVILASVFGRGEGRPGRRAVYGEVRVGGQPVAKGSISFYPAEGQAGPAANTAIVNGRFRFSRNDGPFAGPHHVVLAYVRDAADEWQFKLPGEKERESPPPGAEPAPDGGGTDNAPAEAPGAEARSHGHECDREVPAKGSLQIDFDIPN